MNHTISRAELEWYFNRILRMTNVAVMTERRRLIKLINGDVFPSFAHWRFEDKNVFMRRPLDGVNLQQVMMFLLCNGCPSWIVSQWCITSFWYAEDSARRISDLDEIQSIILRVKSNQSDVAYYDIEKKMYRNNDESNHDDVNNM